MKSNLHAVYNDPKLNRFKETTRIQPLFKKKFEGDGVVSLNGTANPTPVVQQPARNKSTSSLHLDPLQNRLPPTGAKSQEDIYLVLQKLKAEKLEVMRDLYTYEERYEKKLSMRARLKDMNSFCTQLEAMAGSAQGQIQTEQTLFEKLLLGLQTFALRKMQRSLKKATAYEDLEAVVPEGVWSFQISKLVSGLRCLVYGHTEGPGKDLEVVLHLDDSPAVFKLTIPRTAFSHPKDPTRFLAEAYRSVLSHLFFQSSNSKLTLTFDPAYGTQWIQVITHLKGSPYPYNCIRLTKTQDSTQFSMREILLSASDMKLSVPTEKFRLSKSLGTLTEAEQQKLVQVVTARLSLMEDEHGESRLEWDVNEWQMEHGLYRIKEGQKSASLVSMAPHRSLKQKYEEFYLLVYTAQITIKTYLLEVSLHFSTIAETYRLHVKSGSWECDFYEEEFREEFDFVKSLQFHSLQQQPVTLFRSVEFRVMLQRLLNI